MKKSVLIALRKKAESLPPLIETTSARDEIPNGYRPVSVQVNHTRRMKEAFKKNGIAGVNEYMKWAIQTSKNAQ